MRINIHRAVFYIFPDKYFCRIGSPGTYMPNIMFKYRENILFKLWFSNYYSTLIIELVVNRRLPKFLIYISMF